MGYYSSIAICLSSKAYEKVTDLCDKLKLNPNKRINKSVSDHEIIRHEMMRIPYPSDYQHIKWLLDRCTFFNIDKETGTALYFWKSEKYYREYPEYELFHYCFKDLDDTEYLLIRIGELWPDIEVLGDFQNNCFELKIKKTIKFKLDSDMHKPIYP
jgi:hypothetical protein